MSGTVIFNGTPSQALELCNAINEHCMCQYDAETGAKTSVCRPHDAMVHDQRFLNGLLFARHQVERLLVEEFMT